MATRRRDPRKESLTCSRRRETNGARPWSEKRWTQEAQNRPRAAPLCAKALRRFPPPTTRRKRPKRPRATGLGNGVDLHTECIKDSLEDRGQCLANCLEFPEVVHQEPICVTFERGLCGGARSLTHMQGVEEIGDKAGQELWDRWGWEQRPRSSFSRSC